VPDLARIDIGLGEEPDGGLTLCRELRALAPSLPILFLTARDSDFDAVSGLRLGADDYLTKDVSLPHLLARISALFRRIDALREPKAAEEVLERGALRLDARRFAAWWNGRPAGLKLASYFSRASLCTKLALVALVLLALPWAGYEYVREMERFLLEGEEQALLATARAVATALHDRPGLMRARPSRDDDLLREAEEELRRLAAERGEAQPEPGAEPAPIIDREEAAAKNETEEI